MTREEQMMEAAEAYAAGLYADEPVSFSTEESMCETMNDFCAGWRTADRCPQWIPVDRELPEKEEDNPSLSVNVIVTDGNSVFESYYSFNLHIWAGTDIYGTITHWMPLPAPPKKGGDHDK